MLALTAEVLSTLSSDQISEEQLINYNAAAQTNTNNANMQLVPVQASAQAKTHSPDDDSLGGDETGFHIRSVSSVYSEPSGNFSFSQTNQI